jgi:hypothetical protein
VRLQVANKDSYSPEQVIPSKRKKRKKKRALWLGIYPSIHPSNPLVATSDEEIGLEKSTHCWYHQTELSAG